MKIPSQSGRSRGRVNITPLIDIVFLLIIFFLAASHFVRSEAVEPIVLPNISEADSADENSPSRLVLTITAEEKLMNAGREIDIETFHRLLPADASPEFEVRIRADKSAHYGIVEPLLTACAQAGIGNVKFAVAND